MKKLIAALLIVLCVFTLAACGGSDTPASEATDRPTTEERTAAPDEEKTPAPDEEKTPAPIDPEEKQWERFSIAGHNYCLYYDAAKRLARAGSFRTTMFYGGGYDCIVLNQKYDKTFSGDAHAALKNNNDGEMLVTVTRYIVGDTFEFASQGLVSVTKEEEAVTVNGIETVRFEGTAGENGQHFVYGYAFVFDGVPNILFGIVMKTAEHEERIAPIKTEVDAMMQTFKNKEE